MNDTAAEEVVGCAWLGGADAAFTYIHIYFMYIATYMNHVYYGIYITVCATKLSSSLPLLPFTTERGSTIVHALSPLVHCCSSEQNGQGVKKKALLLCRFPDYLGSFGVPAARVEVRPSVSSRFYR